MTKTRKRKSVCAKRSFDDDPDDSEDGMPLLVAETGSPLLPCSNNNTESRKPSREAFEPCRKSPRLAKQCPYEPTQINYSLSFKDLGGLEDEINIILQSVIYRQENASSLKKYGLRSSVGGILLVGPPGTGKTVCAQTIAAELSRRRRVSYSFFTHEAVQCLSKWMGDSEKIIRDLFKSAAECSPSIIFFDEFDALCPRRSEEVSGHSYRTVVATLLSEFNKIYDNEILVIATTNIVDNIDPAMLRHGRFDFLIHFPLPNGVKRKDILKIKLKECSVREEAYNFVVQNTEGASGATLTFLSEEAKLWAFKRQRDTLERKSVLKVEKEDFLEAFKTLKLPLSITENETHDMFQEICEKIITKIKPFLFTDVDLTKFLLSNQCTLSSNCFLVWSTDSNVVLNTIIFPRVLQDLGQQVLKVSATDIDNDDEYSSVGQLIQTTLQRAKSVKRPVIVWFENIDTLEIDPRTLHKLLFNLGSHLVFLLATSATSLSNLPKDIQQLFKPLGIEKSVQLPCPTEPEISAIITCLFQQHVDPLYESSHPKKLKRLAASSYTASILKCSSLRSYEKMHLLRSEIILQCKVSSAETITDNLLQLIKR